MLQSLSRKSLGDFCFRPLLALALIASSLVVTTTANAEEPPNPNYCPFSDIWNLHAGAWRDGQFHPPVYYTEAVECWLSRLNLEDQKVRLVLETYLLPGVPVVSPSREPRFEEMEKFTSLSHEEQAHLANALLEEPSKGSIESEWQNFFSIRSSDERRLCTWELAILQASSHARHGIRLPHIIFDTRLKDCLSRNFSTNVLDSQLQDILGASRSDFDSGWLSLLVEHSDGLLARRESVLTETCAIENRVVGRAPSIQQNILCDWAKAN